MEIHVTQVGSIGTNCYVVETAQKNCAIIDPGDEGKRLVEWVKSLGLTPVAILLTHGHFDHIGGVADLVEAYPEVKIYINRLEEPVIKWSEQSLENPKSASDILTKGIHIKDGEVITVDEIDFTVMYTPGHTQGGVVYLTNDVMFSGDTLFYKEIGRCDLITGDYEVMLKSLKKLADLKGDYTVYPGHEQSTTLEFERNKNPYMKKVL